MNFNFNTTAGASQSTVRPVLEGNKIHTVTFDGCEARDFEKRDGTGSFHVLEIKFSNSEGTFTHTIWEPREEDAVDRSSAYGLQPSNVLCMMYMFKHLIDTVNPELSAKIDSGEVSLNAPTWDGLRQLVVKATTPGIGKTTKIKLIKNNKGEASFPYFLAFVDATKGGAVRMTTNFIGDGVFFSSKEMDKIKKSETAKPTVMAAPKIEIPVTGSFDSAAPAGDDFINMNF